MTDDRTRTGQGCTHCGQDQSVHWAVNYAAGPYASGTVLVCPTAVFKASEPRPELSEIVDALRKKAEQEQRPHGPVSERFMRHHYGASGAKRK